MVKQLPIHLSSLVNCKITSSLSLAVSNYKTASSLFLANWEKKTPSLSLANYKTTSSLAKCKTTSSLVNCKAISGLSIRLIIKPTSILYWTNAENVSGNKKKKPNITSRQQLATCKVALVLSNPFLYQMPSCHLFLWPRKTPSGSFLHLSWLTATNISEPRFQMNREI